MKGKNILFLLKLLVLTTIILFIQSCNDEQGIHGEKKPVQTSKSNLQAKDILGNPDYAAIAFGGYRHNTRSIQPTVEELKEDMKILSAMGIKIIRTYHTKMAHASNVLKAIRSLQEEDASFEMYVMLGAWINCKDAWTNHPDHNNENAEENKAEVDRAVKMAQKYPDIIKIIAIGNEAMVHWASTYYVQPKVILKYVNQLQSLKMEGKLPTSLWITSSDNFASWGGGSLDYHNKDLRQLIHAVDYISMHTYPMHDTHYNPQFWGNTNEEENLTKLEKITRAMVRAKDYAALQYKNTANFIHSIDPLKKIHIGETGWSSGQHGLYGPEGSKATDEYKEGLYYKLIQNWAKKEGISCFYFEAFDEPWKDNKNVEGSENHFGLFTVEGKAKYPLWALVDKGVFKNLSRGGKGIAKTYGGDEQALLKKIALPPLKDSIRVAYK